MWVFSYLFLFVQVADHRVHQAFFPMNKAGMWRRCNIQSREARSLWLEQLEEEEIRQWFSNYKYVFWLLAFRETKTQRDFYSIKHSHTHIQQWTWLGLEEKGIGWEGWDGTQPHDEMHAILGGPINEEEWKHIWPSLLSV